MGNSNKLKVALTIIALAVVASEGSQRSLLACTGEPCANPQHCRSKFGHCGIGDAWCNDESTWRVSGCSTPPAATTPSPSTGSSDCPGEPCSDSNHCRSKWGYCGTGPDYCNRDSLWSPTGCGAAIVPTNSPTSSSTKSPTKTQTNPPLTKSPTMAPVSTGAPANPPITKSPTKAPVTTASKSPTKAPVSDTASPTNAPVTSGSSCSGQPCPSGMCRSEWGYCGATSAYCNGKSTWTPACSGTVPTTTVAPSSIPSTKEPSTRSPNNIPGSTSAPTTTRNDDDPNSLLGVVRARKPAISNSLLQSLTPSNVYVASKVYKADDLEAGLRAAINGIAGMGFIADGIRGRLNLAAFLAQAIKETILYDVCDENSWDLVGGVYPASNACGQLGQQYDQYHCSAAEAHMECPVDLQMEKKAATNAQWYGAPAPLFCAPRSRVPQSPGWNHGLECIQPWANPPRTCDEYQGQKAGGFDYSRPHPNSAGRTDVEGCCWWGRGVIQLTGPCNVGKLNYFLGKKAHERGVPDAPFPDVDFCREPDAICASEKYPELKWVSGFFYWMHDVQAGAFSGWNYQTELNKVAANPNDQNLRRAFINGVSGVVNRGSPYAGNVDGLAERASNFETAWAVLGSDANALAENGPLIADQDPDSSNMPLAAGIAGGVLGVLASVGIAFGLRRLHATRNLPGNELAIAGSDLPAA